jgi:hypothetical protein
MTRFEHAVEALFDPVGVAAFRRDARGRRPVQRPSRVALVAVAVTVVVLALSSPTQPAAADRAATTIVYDSFTGADYGLDDYASKWNNGFGPGEMAIEDTRTFDGSAFSVSALPFRTAADVGVFDHIKYLALSSDSFAVPETGSITFAAEIDATTIGTDPAGRVIHGVYGPSGCADVPSCAAGRTPWEGVAREGQQAGATLHMIDFATGQLFDWFVSGSTAFALVERLPATVIGSPLGGTRSTIYTQIVKEVRIGPGPHDVAIRFSRRAGRSAVEFVVDGRRLARVRQVGVPLDVQRARFTGTFPSLGPGEQLGERIDSVTIGHGMFSLLDAFPFQHPDAPEASVSIPLSERIWGQGVAATFDDFTVTIDDRS